MRICIIILPDAVEALQYCLKLAEQLKTWEADLKCLPNKC